MTDAAPPPHRQMTAAEWALLLVLSVLWGGSFFFNHIAVAALPPLTVVTVRVALAAAVLWLVVLARGVPVPRSRTAWIAFTVMGLFNNALPFSLIVWGQSHIASGVAAILNASTPLFGVVLAHLLTDEKLTASRASGVLLGLGGVAVMMGGAALGGGILFAAQAACVLAAICYAVSGLYGRRFGNLGLAPLATAAGMLTCSSLLLMPVALAFDQPWTLPRPDAAVFVSLGALAVLSTAIAYIVFFRLLATAGTINLLLVTLLVPVTAVLLGVVVLGEALLPRHLAGMALIAIGLAAIDGRPIAWLRGQPRATT